jgi:hypothetical protein
LSSTPDYINLYGIVHFVDSLFQRELGGALEIYYPDGLDLPHYGQAAQQAEQIAEKLAEPVILSFYAAARNFNVSRFYLPASFEHNDEPAVARVRDELEGAVFSAWISPFTRAHERMLDENEWDLNLTFPTSSLGSVFFVETYAGANQQQIHDRLFCLGKKLNEQVIAPAWDESKIMSARPVDAADRPRIWGAAQRFAAANYRPQLHLM